MQNDLQDKHVVVTGGTGALGAAVVRAVLDRGAHVHVPRLASAMPSQVPFDDERVHVSTSIDLADEASVVSYYESLPPLWGSVHCAGGFAMASLADTSLADFERMWRTNAVSCFLCCREAVRSMRRGAGGGRVVNVAARPAVEPTGGMVAYSTSKAAVASMTECLARELVGDRILVNAVLPSIVDTPANRAAMPGADHERWPKPAAIAETIAFALSPGNRLTSGALLPVYGAQL